MLHITTTNKTTLRFVSVILTLLTVIGGHPLVGRMRFGLIFLLSLVLLPIVNHFVFIIGASIDGAREHDGLLSPYYIIFWCGFFIIYVFSLVSLVNSFSSNGAITQEKSTVIGAILLSLIGFFIVLYYFLAMLLLPLGFDSEDRPATANSFKSSERHLGDSLGVVSGFPAGIISGRVFVDGAPLSGVNVTLHFRGGSRSESVATDLDGAFRVFMPEGEWELAAPRVSGYERDEISLTFESPLSGTKPVVRFVPDQETLGGALIRIDIRTLQLRNR